MNVPRRSARAGMQPGSASGRNGSAMPRSAAKRACYCAQWRGWARAVSIARQLAYWSIDAVIGRRRAKEYDAARVRWEATKIVLASERKRAREEKPMDYRSFVNERARARRPRGTASDRCARCSDARAQGACTAG